MDRSSSRPGPSHIVAPDPPPSAPEHILNGNDQLTPTENNEIRERVDTAKSTLRTLRATMDCFRTAETELEKYVQRHEPLLSRSRSIPPELWAVIFLIAQTEHDSKAPQNSISPTAPCIQVGYVCRAWRRISTTTSSLWTNIALQDDDLYFLPGRTALLDLWLTRSGGLPLDIYFYQYSRKERRDILSTALSLLLHHSHRWASFTLRIGRPFLRSSGLKITHAPILHTLKLEVLSSSSEIAYGDIPSDPEIFEAGSTPQLKTVSFKDVIPLGPGLRHLQGSNIKSVNLDFENVCYLESHLQYFLDKCPSLEDLTIEACSYEDEWETPSKFSHDGLQSLSIRFGGFAMLGTLKTPSLRRLCLNRVAEKDLPEVTYFIAHTPSLRELSIDGDNQLPNDILGTLSEDLSWSESVETAKITCIPDEHLVSLLAALSGKSRGSTASSTSLTLLEISLYLKTTDLCVDQLAVVRVKDSIIELCRQLNTSKSSSVKTWSHCLKRIKLEVDLWRKGGDNHLASNAFHILREMEFEGFDYHLRIH